MKAATFSAALALFVALPDAAVSAEDFDLLAEKCAPSVAADTLKALVKTESGFNPFAIGVVGDSVRQPQSLQEAVFTVTKLVAAEKSFSVGLAQINSANFAALGLTAEQLFDPCTNLKAAAVILGKCYEKGALKDEARALADALSCYYSGNEKTGYEHGYVDRVIANAPPPSVPSIRLLTGSAASVREPEPPLITVPERRTAFSGPVF